MQALEARAYLIEPPYRFFSTAVAISGTLPIKRGTVVAVRPAATASSQAIRDAVRAARQAVLGAPLMLWIDRIPPQRAVRLATHARALGVAGFVQGTEPDPAALREQLTDPFELGVRVTYWLGLLGFDLHIEPRYFVTQFFDHALDHTTAGTVVVRARSSMRHVERVLAHHKLANPGAWFRVARAVRIGLIIQREPHGSLPSVVEQLGFLNAGSLGRLTGNHIGASPGFIRAHLGWQWILRDALRLEGVMPRR